MTTFYENQRIRVFCAVITRHLNKGQPTNIHEKAKMNCVRLALHADCWQLKHTNLL